MSILEKRNKDANLLYVSQVQVELAMFIFSDLMNCQGAPKILRHKISNTQMQKSYFLFLPNVVALE